MDINLMRKKSEYLKVQAAKADLEIIIYQKEKEIERLREALEIQIKKESELKTEIEQGENNHG